MYVHSTGTFIYLIKYIIFWLLHYKLSQIYSLKQGPLIISQLCRLRSPAQFCLILSTRYFKIKINVLTVFLSGGLAMDVFISELIYVVGIIQCLEVVKSRFVFSCCSRKLFSSSRIHSHYFPYGSHHLRSQNIDAFSCFEYLISVSDSDIKGSVSPPILPFD